MRFIRTKAVIATVGLALSLAACGDAGDDGGETTDVEVQENAGDEFDDGTAMKEFADSGEITIGVKYDQPGIGFKGATDDMPVGFDPEIGKILAAVARHRTRRTSPGRRPSPTTASRSSQEGEVDLVIASYSITDERRQVVGQAGPYYVTGQQLLVKSDSDIESLEDVKGTEVCSVTGSTSLENIKAEGAKPRGFDTYSECVDQVLSGTVDAMTTDGAILLGYAAENPDELKVVVEPFSEERYGVGYSIDKPEMCQWIVDTHHRGAGGRHVGATAFEATLGQSGVDTPEPPAMDECPAA